MSTFKGHLEEIPEICIDFFESKEPNLMFFVSHCHTDHMKGLNLEFFKSLKSNGNRIYCTHVSKLILENMYSNAGIKNLNIIEALDTNCPINMTSSLTVTCIPSGHCPGSVMFLFEKNDKTILYTGDFRLNAQDLPKLKALHIFDTHVPRKFDRIYLDTTFLTKSFDWLPSREDSAKEILKLSQEWLEKDYRNHISIECSANYGYENLFIELSKKLREKIHVKNKVYDSYRRISEIFPYITGLYDTRVHACRNKQNSRYKNQKQDRKWRCPDAEEEFVLTIVASVMIWEDKNVSIISQKHDERENTINVCYSTHSSYQELAAFIKYFKCKDIVACVENKGVGEELEKLLNEEMKEEAGERVPENFRFSESRPKKMRLDDEWE